MSNQRSVTFWIPLCLSAAFLIFGLALPALPFQVPPSLRYAAIAVAALLVVWTGYLAFKDQSATKKQVPTAGVGGRATAKGTNSNAIGGKGGDARYGLGGAGGNALVKGNNSSAKGGDGGNA